MNFLKEIKSTITWKVEPSEVPLEGIRKPMLVPALKVSVWLTPESAPVTRHFSVTYDGTIETMVALTAQTHSLPIPALQKWQESRGKSVVALEPDALENLSYLMHSALRKLADSPMSVITWNGLHQLHEDDSQAIWAAARKVLTSAFNNTEPVTRRNLAQALKSRILSTLEQQKCSLVTDAGAPEARDRNAPEHFALLAMIAACDQTSLDEWMWCWLGFVVRDVPVVKSAA